MTIPASTLSFTGCTTRAEAANRLRAWLEEIGTDSERKFVTDALTADADADPDPDDLDNCVAETRRARVEVIEQAVGHFVRFMDVNNIGSHERPASSEISSTAPPDAPDAA